MTSAYDEALRLVLAQEGGRVDDPRDPGGRTNFGVTQSTYDAWRQRRHQLRRSVFGIEPSEVAAIYRHDYAEPLRFDDLPPGVGYAVLDAGINSGVSRAARWLEVAVGCGPDGRIGVACLAACRMADPARLIDAVCDARLGLMRHLPTWAHFGAGWTRRVAFVRKQAHALAAAAPAPR